MVELPDMGSFSGSRMSENRREDTRGFTHAHPPNSREDFFDRDGLVKVWLIATELPEVGEASFGRGFEIGVEHAFFRRVIISHFCTEFPPNPQHFHWVRLDPPLFVTDQRGGEIHWLSSYR